MLTTLGLNTEKVILIMGKLIQGLSHESRKALSVLKGPEFPYPQWVSLYKTCVA